MGPHQFYDVAIAKAAWAVRGVMPPPPPFRPPTATSGLLPNWALGLVLVGFVGGTYSYVLSAVGKSDVDAAIEAHQQSQQRSQGGAAGRS